MGVGLDEARGDELSLGVDLHRVRGDLDLLAFAGLRLRLGLAQSRCGFRPHVGDLFARGRDEPVLDEAEGSISGEVLRPRHGRDPPVADEQGRGVHGCSALRAPPVAGKARSSGFRVNPGIWTPRSRATWIASSYPASAWRRTPIAGSLVRTRSSLRAAASVPSATMTWPACNE